RHRNQWSQWLLLLQCFIPKERLLSVSHEQSIFEMKGCDNSCLAGGLHSGSFWRHSPIKLWKLSLLEKRNRSKIIIVHVLL
ncbi:hypothetical protein XELAEV_18016189mg, partial [Xenopus laevis]